MPNMQKTYGLDVFTTHGRNPLALPLMTLAQAEKARAMLSQWSDAIRVVNRATS